MPTSHNISNEDIQGDPKVTPYFKITIIYF